MDKQLSNEDIKKLITAFGSIVGLQAYFEIEAVDYNREILDFGYIKDNLREIDTNLKSILEKLND